MKVFFLIPGHGGVDGLGPGVDASADGLDLFKALIAEPDGHVHAADAGVAHGGDVGVGVEFLQARGDFAHGNPEGSGDASGLDFCAFAHVEKDKLGFF